MKQTLSISLILLLITFSGFDSPQQKILIIGDSISIGYMPYVWKYYQGKAMVTHNPGNGQHTGTGLEKIEEWIGDEDWDLIQLNWGLWDLVYRHLDSKANGNRDKVNGKATFTIDEYASNLDSIITKIKELTDAKLIFVTTSYVPEEESGRFSSDPEKYNAAAKAVMQKHGVAVNDIYEDSKVIHIAHGIGSNDVHYTEKGSVELGKLIVGFMEKELNGTNPTVLSDEKQVQNLIQDSFDSLFSAFNEDLILDYYTDDFLLLEQGEIWDIEFIRNYFKQAKSNTPIPVRTNRFEFISTKIEGNSAWVAYQNYGTIKGPDQEGINLHWLESATAVRTAKGWRLDMLHSTRVSELE
jgi:hypothetical protein